LDINLITKKKNEKSSSNEYLKKEKGVFFFFLGMNEKSSTSDAGTNIIAG